MGYLSLCEYQKDSVNIYCADTVSHLYQHDDAELFLRVRNVKGSFIFLDRFFDRSDTQPVGAGVVFIREEDSFLLTDFVLLGIYDLITEITVFPMPGAHGDLPSVRLFYFFTRFDGIIQCVGEDRTERNIIDAHDAVDADVKETVDPIVAGKVVLCVQDGVHDAVLTETSAPCLHISGEILKITQGAVCLLVFQQSFQHGEMAVDVMPDLADRCLVLLQFFVIVLLETQVLPLHVCLYTVCQIRGKIDAPDVRQDACYHAGVRGDLYAGWHKVYETDHSGKRCKADDVKKQP